MTTQRAFASRLINKLVTINLNGLFIDVIVLDTRDNAETTSKVDLLVKPFNNGAGTAWINIDKMTAYEN
jgi:hypothetical protein